MGLRKKSRDLFGWLASLVNVSKLLSVLETFSALLLLFPSFQIFSAGISEVWLLEGGKFIAPINFEFNLHRGKLSGIDPCASSPRFVALILVVAKFSLPRCAASMLMDPYLLFLLQRKSGIRMARVDSPTTSVSQFSLSFSPPPPPSPPPSLSLSFRTRQRENFFVWRELGRGDSSSILVLRSFRYLLVINLLLGFCQCTVVVYTGGAENFIVLFL